MADIPHLNYRQWNFPVPSQKLWNRFWLHSFSYPTSDSSANPISSAFKTYPLSYHFLPPQWAIITPCRDNCNKLLITFLASNSVSQHSPWIQPWELYFYLLNQFTSLFSESTNGFPSQSEWRLRELYAVSLLPALVPHHTLPIVTYLGIYLLQLSSSDIAQQHWPLKSKPLP